ncbi:carbohydrate porin, partial [Enterobacter sp. DRP3]|nr:carbohydrate porin [Enterobacter sp. DRP3]
SPGDRNVVDFAANAGVTLKAPFAGRDNDVAGIAIGYAKIGSHARGLDGDTGVYTTPGYPVRRASWGAALSGRRRRPMPRRANPPQETPTTLPRR